MIRNIVPILFAAIAMVSSPQAASQALPPAGPSTSMPPSAPASVPRGEAPSPHDYQNFKAAVALDPCREW